MEPRIRWLLEIFIAALPLVIVLIGRLLRPESDTLHTIAEVVGGTEGFVFSFVLVGATFTRVIEVENFMADHNLSRAFVLFLCSLVVLPILMVVSGLTDAEIRPVWAVVAIIIALVSLRICTSIQGYRPNITKGGN